MVIRHLDDREGVGDLDENPSNFIFTVTSWIGNHIVEYGLQPFQNFFTETPAPVMLAGLTLIALLLSGSRPAVTTGANISNWPSSV